MTTPEPPAAGLARPPAAGALLTCRVCQAQVDPANPSPAHDVVRRLNTAEGPGPYPFMVLHSPWEQLP